MQCKPIPAERVNEMKRKIKNKSEMKLIGNVMSMWLFINIMCILNLNDPDVIAEIPLKSVFADVPLILLKQRRNSCS